MDPTKSEILEVTGFHVHDGTDTLLMTYNREEASCCAARNDCIGPRKSITEEVAGSRIAAWEEKRLKDFAVFKVCGDKNGHAYHESVMESITGMLAVTGMRAVLLGHERNEH